MTYPCGFATSLGYISKYYLSHAIFRPSALRLSCSCLVLGYFQAHTATQPIAMPDHKTDIVLPVNQYVIINVLDITSTIEYFANEFTVIAPDTPGFGLSDYIDGMDPDITQYAEAV